MKVIRVVVDELKAKIAEIEDVAKKKIATIKLDMIAAKEEEIRAAKPSPKTNIDWKPVIEYVESHMNHLRDRGWMNDDSDFYIAEKVFVAIYGKDVWRWVDIATRTEPPSESEGS